MTTAALRPRVLVEGYARAASCRFARVVRHRVLEQAPDDVRGMRDCARAPTPGGIAVSGPRDLDRAETRERPPGMSVAAKLAAAGFAQKTTPVSPEEAGRRRPGYRGLGRVYVCVG